MTKTKFQCVAPLLCGANCHFWLLVAFELLAVNTMPARGALDLHKNRKTVRDEFGCGQCDGSCFGGHCLFDVIDDAAPPVSRVDVDPHGAALNSRSEQQKARDGDSYGAALDSRSEQQKMIAAPQLQKRVGGPTTNFLKVEDLLRSSKGEQQALEGDVAFLSTETSSLKGIMQADEQELQELRSQKRQLQHQVRILSTGLADIQNREASMAELIRQARNNSMEPSTVDRFATYTESFSGWIISIPSNTKTVIEILKDLIFFLVFSIAIALLYKFRSRIMMFLFDTEEVKLSWQDAVWYGLSCCHMCWPLEPLGRAIGLTYQTVEISEIQLGHLLVGGDVYVQIDIGTNPIFNTRTINKSDGVFLRFKENFKVNVRKTDNPCVFKIIDQDVLVSDQIAQLEINAWEFVNLACKGSADASSGYFRFDLQHRQRRLKQQTFAGFTNPAGYRPYIAMRLREVTNNRYHGAIGAFRAKQAQKEFLQTMESQPSETHCTLDPNTNELKLP